MSLSQTLPENNTEMSGSNKKRRTFVITLCVILILSLVVGWSPLNQLSSKPFQESLTSKQNSVTAVMVATIVLGFAVDAIPLNIGSQVANKLFDIAGYLMVVLGAIVAMKILLAFSLSFSFGIIIPATCLLAIGGLIKGNEAVMVLAKKLTIFALVVVIAIPASVGISMAIDNTFEAERARLLEGIQQNTEDIDDLNSIIDSTYTDSNSLENEALNENALDRLGKLFGNITSTIGEIPSRVGDAITGAVHTALETAKKQLTNLMLLTVQWIVTGCVVPIVTLMGFGFVIKILFGFDINPKLGFASRAIREKTSSASSAMLRKNNTSDSEVKDNLQE